MVGDMCTATNARRLAPSPVNYRSSAAPRRHRHPAVDTPFASRISWLKFEFMQQEAEGDVHLDPYLPIRRLSS